jgi:hypothetical protein
MLSMNAKSLPVHYHANPVRSNSHILYFCPEGKDLPIPDQALQLSPVWLVIRHNDLRTISVPFLRYNPALTALLATALPARYCERPRGGRGCQYRPISATRITNATHTGSLPRSHVLSKKLVTIS